MMLKICVEVFIDVVIVIILMLLILELKIFEKVDWFVLI